MVSLRDIHYLSVSMRDLKLQEKLVEFANITTTLYHCCTLAVFICPYSFDENSSGHKDLFSNCVMENLWDLVKL